MNRKIYLILAVVTCLAFLTGCSSSSTPKVVAITASGGSGQTATITEAFANALVANVTSGGTPASGVTVTFSAPSSGASCTPSPATATTDSSGNASVTCTADSTAGTYSVTASATGATSASFSETNAPPTVFTFYVRGLENNATFGPVYYGIVGAVAFDSTGKVFPDASGNCGEQDYNDGGGTATTPYGVTANDPILATGSSMTVDTTTGLGTLVLATADTGVGVAGVETFAVQFVNPSHALITQFDGSATSSGSMDVQSATRPSDGNFAFTLSGMDSGDFAIDYGGIFALASGAITGTADVNDDGSVTQGVAFTGTVGTSDAYGRSAITGVSINGNALALVSYAVGPEVIRISDMDAGGTAGAGNAAIGSAYGQGAGTFDNTKLGTADVFGIEANSWGRLYAATGRFAPTPTSGSTTDGTFTGEGDADEAGNVIGAALTSGTYTVASNGYGRMTISGGLGSITSLGFYMTDSALNLSDPNNTGGVLGGALVLDLSNDGLTGILVPQAATLAATDLNNSYSFGAQNFKAAPSLPRGSPGWEFDYVGQAPIASLAFASTAVGSINDPFGFLNGTAAAYSAVPFAGTATGPDAAGRYAFPAPGTTGNFAIGPIGTGGPTDAFTVAMYEAGPSLVFTIDEDSLSVSLGTLQMQNAAALKAMHVQRAPLRRATIKAKAKK